MLVVILWCQRYINNNRCLSKARDWVEFDPISRVLKHTIIGPSFTPCICCFYWTVIKFPEQSGFQLLSWSITCLTVLVSDMKYTARFTHICGAIQQDIKNLFAEKACVSGQ